MREKYYKGSYLERIFKGKDLSVFISRWDRASEQVKVSRKVRMKILEDGGHGHEPLLWQEEAQPSLPENRDLCFVH